MDNSNEIKKIARKLRRNQTVEEKKLWAQLRNRKLNGKKFLRQHPIVFRITSKTEFFVVDFFCTEHNLIIEIDGKIHDFNKGYDQNREKILKELGYTIIRFKNEEIKDIPKVLRHIKSHLKD